MEFYKEVDQYDFSFNTRYIFLDGYSVRPYVMGGVTYIYRSYTDQTQDYCSYNNNDSFGSNAVNADLGAGINFQLSKQFSVGIDYRYSLNIFSNSNPSSSQTQGTTSH